MEIKVYSSRQCIKCAYLKDELNKLGVDYKDIDVFKDKKAFDLLDNIGLLRLPVLKIADDKYYERPTVEEVKSILDIG